MGNAEDFKAALKRFTEAIEYVKKHKDRLTAEGKMEIAKKNFVEKFKKPLEAAWKQLTTDEQSRFAMVYFHHKAIQDKNVQEVMKHVGGKIVDITVTDVQKSNDSD